MMPMHTSLQTLLSKIEEHYPDGLFIPQIGKDPRCIGFKCLRNEKLYISVVATNQPKDKYSVQVTLQGPEYEKMIGKTDEGKELTLPFNIFEDRMVGLNELIKIFGKYKSLD